MDGVDSMVGKSGIEWCGETWEVTAGCARVSAGCMNCYAETMVGGRLRGSALARARDGKSGAAVDVSLEVINDRGLWNGEVRELPMNLDQPLKRSTPTVYFVNSRSDLFHEGVDFAYIDRVFAVMAMCPQHRFLILTKRPERMREYLLDRVPGYWLYDYPEGHAKRSSGLAFSMKTHLPNVWLGTSVEDQAACDARVPELLACPVGDGAGRFISAEPLLGSVDLYGEDGDWLLPHPLPNCDAESDGEFASIPWVNKHLDRSMRCSVCGSDGGPIDWVIVGGESGKDSRKCEQEWIRSVVSQCADAGVPVFVKQLGKRSVIDRDGDTWREQGGIGKKGELVEMWPEDLRVRAVPEGLRVGGRS